MPRPFAWMARNNAWCNRRLLAACNRLGDDAFAAPRTGFFPSIRATLCHVYTVDRYYVDAIERSLMGDDPHPDPGSFFDPPEPFATCPTLARAQAEVDARLIAIAERADATGVDAKIIVPRRTGPTHERLSRLLLHLFQHQVHHRGQAHAMLSATDVPPPQLDEFFLDDDALRRAPELAELGWTERAIWAESAPPGPWASRSPADNAAPEPGTAGSDGTHRAANAGVGDVAIRSYREPDRARLVALWAACGLTRPWNDPDRDISRKLRVDADLLLIADAGGEPIGSLMAGYEGHRGWLNYLAVAPGWQRRGIGRRLVDAAIARLRARGCPKVNVQIRRDNLGAASFYARLGFREDDAIGMGLRLEIDDPSAGAGGRCRARAGSPVTSTRTDSAARLIRASPAAIYQAFATPEAMKTWLPPRGMTGSILAFSFRDGGSYRMRLTYDRAEHTRGKTSEDADEVVVRFTRLVPNERIEQAVEFLSDDPSFAGEMRMTWMFDPVHDGTVVTVRCEDVPPGIRPEDHRVGLGSTLDNLAAFAERNVSDAPPGAALQGQCGP